MIPDQGKWLTMLPVEQIERELAELEAQRATLEDEIRIRRGLLELRRRYDQGEQPGIGLPTANGTQPKTRREKVLLIMGSDPNPQRQWARKELQAALADRGWLGRDQKAADNLGETLSEMGEKGDLLRPGIGFYQLPPVPAAVMAAAPEAVAQRVADAETAPARRAR